MATKADLATLLMRVSVVPVVTFPKPDIAVQVADLLAEAGFTCLEVAFRAAGAARAISSIRSKRPDLSVGAGTILSTEQADAALDAGAAFLVTPGTNPRVMEHVLTRGGTILPGVATPSEIEANRDRGLRLMKLFPAAAIGGIGYLTSVYGPYRDVRFVPTGGVNAGNLRSYLALPNVVAVGGTWIAPLAALQAGDLESVRRAAQVAAAVVAAWRQERAVAS